MSADAGGSASTLVPERDQVDVPARTHPLMSWGAVLVPVVIVVAGAWSHRWVAEDAFIDFRVVGNVLAGHGPVFNVGERVEAYTDPLWVAILVLFRGILPFVSVEWWSVILGIGCTITGFVAGGRAAQRLGASTDGALVVPIGLLVASVVAGMWDFTTSGLENGLAFGWLGVSWWLLVRLVERRRSAGPAAFVVGLGFLIRPDLGLISVVFLAALVVTIKSSGWQGPTGRIRRWVGPLVAALALPVVYQLFRMSYFGLLVPNTALAKSAGSTWWSQGALYLRDFESQYWLWFPLLCLVPVAIIRIVSWWRAARRPEACVLAAPLVGGLLSATYVVAVGGDFMHARMLLPGFFSTVLALWVAPRRLPVWSSVAAGLAVAWCIVCLIAFRPTPMTVDPHTLTFVGASNDIDNERSLWVLVSGNPHPVTLGDYSNIAGAGRRVQSRAQRRTTSGGRTGQIVLPQIETLTGRVIVGKPIPARSDLPEPIITNFQNIGIRGLAAGSNVYLFDELSLANPIGSHFRVVRRSRPGHEKVIGSDWMLARFTPSGTTFPTDLGVTPVDVDDAREALACPPLRSYLAEITGPWTFAKASSSFVHSIATTGMNFSSRPSIAARELCGSEPNGSRPG